MLGHQPQCLDYSGFDALFLSSLIEDFSFGGAVLVPAARQTRLPSKTLGLWGREKGQSIIFVTKGGLQIRGQEELPPFYMSIRSMGQKGSLLQDNQNARMKLLSIRV